ncbi:hypothetical protein BP951000_0109 [Brachyspira pilosicoli 95/1000]|uniref:Uncharacterized protein n=1 Tax=Brachyspira pilosicoli (strain ATCC BAA-1826 / 95/1000) TaxID=759914 RepID=D8IA01_BRAP9|nr:hypothetical protein BP951000_0109 [Brachyspira pilosicoli 95/1000]
MFLQHKKKGIKSLIAILFPFKNSAFVNLNKHRKYDNK